ncbi:MAG: hypothetical protein EKK71_09730 [Candidatus Competibacteraceae bacterium]|nr:MAG: hypothetical protein EKK71_09730 [Candidatus Competibacteraceae bacterium]
MNTYTTLDAIRDMFVIYGIVIVVSMLVATVIRGIVLVLSRQSQPDPAKPAKPASAPRPIAATPAMAGIPQEHLAVITAAVAAMMDTHRIVHIEAASRGYNWTAEARTVHHTSHVPRAPH